MNHPSYSQAGGILRTYFGQEWVGAFVGTSRLGAGRNGMVIFEAFLAGDGTIEFSDERATFFVSVWVCVHFPRTEVIERQGRSVFVILLH
jgi:hypothetical protein